jgi:hypothetical protein
MYADVRSAPEPAPLVTADRNGTVDSGAHTVEVIYSQRLGGHPELSAERTRTDVDAVRHQGRTYLAYRAEGDRPGRASIQVLSSKDERVWRQETQLLLNDDLQKPRFLEFQGELFLYASVLDHKSFEVAPLGVYATKLDESSLWESWRRLELDGQVAYRATVAQGRALLTTYSQSPREYVFDDPVLDVRLLTTEDGFNWHPLQVGDAVVHRGSGGETALVSDDDGNLVSLINNQAGAQRGWGASLCVAPLGQWTDWDCKRDSRRYDGARLFAHNGQLYVVARRRIDQDENSFQALGHIDFFGRLGRQAEELLGRHRCSLWHYDNKARQLHFVLDLPSQGDTCSPAVLSPGAADEVVVYTHSSDITEADTAYGPAKKHGTHIYRHVLRFSKHRDVRHASY